MKSYNTKTIIAGNHIRRIDATLPILYDFTSKKQNYSKSLEGEKTNYSMRRTQDNLVLTIDSNVNHWSKFITLTFEKPIIDRQQAMDLFNNFTKRFKQAFNEPLKYVGVTERQLKRGIKEDNAGSWHFHLVVFNNKKLDFLLLKETWQYGSVDIKKIDKVQNLGKYLGKYLSKSNNNGINKKSVIKSYGLNKPTMLYDELPYNDMKETYKTSYEHINETTGEVIEYTVTDYIISK